MFGVSKRIGIVEILKVSRHGSGFYLRIPKDVVDWLDLESGDKVRIKVEEIFKRREVR